MRKYFLLFISLFLAASTFAQKTDSLAELLMNRAITVRNFGKSLPQEKVYIHFDNTSYYQGDKIWFQCYVVTADKNKPTDLSKTLYVELLNPEGIVLEKHTLPIVDGRCHGDFSLVHLPFHSGFYEVRAYTRTMLNFADAGVFSRVFPVYEAPEKEGDYSNPTIRRWNNPYDIQRPEAEKTKALTVSFYPEGGNLVMGIPCRIAFKAIGANGQGVEVSGELQTEEGEAPTTLTTQHDGMGQFTLTPTKKRHTAEFTYEGKRYTFRLPEPVDKGYTLMADNLRPGQLRGRLTGYAGCPDELMGVMLICRGTVAYFDTLSVRNGAAAFIIPKEKLTVEYLRRLSYNVGVSQLRRARYYHRKGRVRLKECVKWFATLALAAWYGITLQWRKAKYLIIMRYNITRGLWSEK